MSRECFRLLIAWYILFEYLHKGQRHQVHWAEGSVNFSYIFIFQSQGWIFTNLGLTIWLEILEVGK